MDEQIILTIGGSFISLVLMVNAHFTRKLLEKMTSIELRLVEYTTKHDSTDQKTNKNSDEIEELKEKLHNLEMKMMSQ